MQTVAVLRLLAANSEHHATPILFEAQWAFPLAPALGQKILVGPVADSEERLVLELRDLFFDLEAKQVKALFTLRMTPMGVAPGVVGDPMKLVQNAVDKFETVISEAAAERWAAVIERQGFQRRSR